MNASRTLALCVALAAACVTPAASATVLTNQGNGIAAPSYTIDFSGQSVGADVSNAYAADGLTFFGLNAVSLYGETFAPTKAPAVVNFYAGINNSFGFNFDNAVTDVSFFLVTNGAGTTITSYLKGTAVESFNVGRYLGVNSFQGFTNTMIDSVRFNVGGDGLALMDNVDFTNAQTNDVPEPTSIALLALGLAGIAARRRKA
ncbi:PEP-CTERM sorting domain-containing protein [Massilia sp. CMS3.1]|uniref:PEP-CTERM sorting domain-containing protein n=1 Tax=Massilia sp. CMS3.1 TaxID=3373083 RepID=UPI003EE70211